ncbi:glutamine-hydrolyzing carbamoyl-phosphate synthase small subunit [candidate division KSB1 bacterium]|nr:glutamine-hydrolyzing carbamoyl-phosphate synthase small subunit [candidate division KSB1 bacterium]
MRAVLLLEDGTLFEGDGFGAKTTAIGEVVFNTGMTGYQEILTDPSYKGQIVTMTYPHIGNYGINAEDMESLKPHVEGYVVRELCRAPSNYRSTGSLNDYLKEHNIPGIEQIDTRMLTRHIRSKGSMMGVLCAEDRKLEDLKVELAAHPQIEGRDLVQYVTVEEQQVWEVSTPQNWYYENLTDEAQSTHHVVAYDFGIKHNILRLLTSFGMKVTVVTASTPAERVMEMQPDGVFLSNGPGDPTAVDYAVRNVKELIGKVPIFGICLGHQILGLAIGAKTYKLKFGHHGCNHPVKRLETGEIEITSQNHNFAVDPDSLKGTGMEITHVNLNDKTIEGVRHKELPIFSVQCHPEASPGPHDSLYLFRTFKKMMQNA